MLAILCYVRLIYINMHACMFEILPLILATWFYFMYSLDRYFKLQSGDLIDILDIQDIFQNGIIVNKT